MKEHVMGELADYLEGRLQSDRVKEVDAHLLICPECSASFAWARDFREAAMAQGLRHLSAERLVELADGGVVLESPGEKRHLESCAACGRELAWVRDLPSAEELIQEAGAAELAGRSRRGRSVPRRVQGLAWLAAAAGILIFFLFPRERGNDTSDLAQIEPLPVRFSRSPAEPGSFEAHRMRGLELYAEERYAEARDEFREAAAIDPERPEVRLYQASSELLLYNLEEATVLLQGITGAETDAALREEALWQLAQVHLASGKVREAEETIRQVSVLDGRHAGEAAALLGRLGADSH